PLLHPRTVTLRDGTLASIHPYHTTSTPHLRINPEIVRILAREFDEELERGDTYPLEEPMGEERFEGYWFGSFGAVMVVGTGEGGDNGEDWEGRVLGCFYVKPNYPGRSSHICNAGFLTTHAARNRGCGKKLGEAYLEYAPKLGYVYSIFNLVYETNTASLRIWDSLGFERIGRVKGAGRLKSYPGRYVDAVIYGRDLV
ncbi:putative GNAT family acetyltransferase, partial [Ascodesmis nigricans]